MKHTNGWIGTASEIFYYLSTIGADRDEATDTGAFMTRGPAPHFGGRDEVIVHADTEVFVGGRPVNLAAALASTSYGLSVRVF